MTRKASKYAFCTLFKAADAMKTISRAFALTFTGKILNKIVIFLQKVRLCPLDEKHD